MSRPGSPVRTHGGDYTAGVTLGELLEGRDATARYLEAFGRDCPKAYRHVSCSQWRAKGFAVWRAQCIG